MKWKCSTSQLLSVPVAAAVIGFGMSAIGQDQSSPVQSVKPADTSMTDDSPLRPGQPDMGRQIARPVGEISAGDGRQWRKSAEEFASDDTSCGEMVTQNNDPKTVVFPNVPVCNGAETVETWIARTWAAGELSSICAFKFGIGEIQGAQANTQIDVFVKQGGAAGSNPAAMPVLCTATVGIPGVGSNGEFFTVKFDPTCNPDPSQQVTIALRIAAPVGSGTFVFPAGNNLGESAPTYIASAGCGIVNYQTMASIGFPDAMVLMQVFDGEGEPTPGACCLPKEDGEDQGCIDGILGGECADLGGIFHVNAVCDNVVCPTQVECPEDACPACVGDINDSGVVDGGDLLLLLGCWGAVEPGCECADLNNSGVVDGGDLLLLLGNWGPCPTGDGGPAGSVFDENEPCGVRLNDGCNIDPPAFDNISCGDIVCGTAWTAVEPGELPDGHLPGTCEGNCGGGDGPPGCYDSLTCNCYCDDECFGFGDCCIDICEWCEPPDVPECVAGDVNTRDTDWYRIVVDEKQHVTWRVHAEFPAQAIIATVIGDCEETIIIQSASSPAKVPFEISACLQPGIEYILFVSPSVFEGLPCDGEGQWGDAYTAEVVCKDDAACPKGACCFLEDCVADYDEFLCGLDGGLYQGDGTDCADNPCALPVGACCLNDGVCVDVNIDDCINDLRGAYRGNGTNCSDMVPLDLGCNGQEQLVPICRSCDGGDVWCNLQDVCDEDIDQDPYNGGCNYWDPDEGEFEAAFEQVCCGDLVGGTVWSIQGQGRDLDWRHLTIKEDSVVTISIDHGFGAAGLNAILFFARAGCPANILESATVPTGGALVRQLEAGNYYVIVAPEFSTGNNIECGTPASQYQLQISCGTVNEDTCAGNCGAPFQMHDGYPAGFCSCDPDSCLPLGGSNQSETEHCCPGICDHCDGAICEILCSYRYDNSEFQGGIGLDDPPQTILWLHRDVTPPGGDTIHEIRTNYSHTHSGGLPVGWAIFEAAGDGTIGTLIASANNLTTEAGAVGNGDIFSRQVFNTGGVAVPDGEFFYAVFSTGSSHPAPWEETGGLDSEVWIAACDDTWDNCNPAVLHPNDWSFPPSVLSPFGIQAIWLMCANGE